MEAGLDSLGAVELRNALASLFAVDLPATVTFDHPTAVALGTFIAGLYHAALAADPVTDSHALLMTEPTLCFTRCCTFD